MPGPGVLVVQPSEATLGGFRADPVWKYSLIAFRRTAGNKPSTNLAEIGVQFESHNVVSIIKGPFERANI